VEKPLVYKLHGSLDDIKSLVLTEDDAIDFVVCMMIEEPPLPDEIRALFQKHSILFIGSYGLKDWNIRVLLRYLCGKEEQKNYIRSFAIQRFEIPAPDHKAAQEWKSMVAYWNAKKISIYNCDALEFLRELDRRYRREIGQ